MLKTLVEKNEPTKEVKVKSSDVKNILSTIKKIMVDKKCEEITVLNLKEVNSYLSYFVICNVNSSTHGKAVSRDIEKTLKSFKLGLGNQDKGTTYSDSGWILLDYGDILVHIMTPEKREFYALERLWRDAKPMDL